MHTSYDMYSQAGRSTASPFARSKGSMLHVGRSSDLAGWLAGCAYGWYRARVTPGTHTARASDTNKTAVAGCSLSANLLKAT